MLRSLIVAIVVLSTVFFSDCTEYCHKKMYCIDETKSEIRDVDQVKAEFRLFMKDNKEEPEIVAAYGDHNWADKDIPSKFVKNGKTLFIIHGFQGGQYKAAWMTPMKDAIVENRKADNVFLVDWNKGAEFGIKPTLKVLNLVGYLVAAKTTEVVGSIVANYTRFLVEKGVLDYDDVHCIGFSLGGQVCGCVGSYSRDASTGGPLLGRITGLDPAGPYFDDAKTDLKKRLDTTDAKFVDVIHTNAGTFGTVNNIGHVDFHPGKTNKWVGKLGFKYFGVYQPGCNFIGYCVPKLLVNLVSKVPFKAGIKDKIGQAISNWAGCSHIRAPDYFTNSIKGVCSYSTKGNTMGWNASPNGALGKIDLGIPNKKPYC